MLLRMPVILELGVSLKITLLTQMHNPRMPPRMLSQTPLVERLEGTLGALEVLPLVLQLMFIKFNFNKADASLSRPTQAGESS